MASTGGDGTDIVSDFVEMWTQQARNATEVWRDEHRRLAHAYREHLDRMGEDDQMEAEWARSMQRLFLESIKAQRTARQRLIENQKSMVDQYLDFLSRLDEYQEPTSGDDSAAAARSTDAEAEAPQSDSGSE
jgi:hypothetical protein